MKNTQLYTLGIGDISVAKCMTAVLISPSSHGAGDRAPNPVPLTQNRGHKSCPEM